MIMASYIFKIRHRKNDSPRLEICLDIEVFLSRKIPISQPFEKTNLLKKTKMKYFSFFLSIIVFASCNSNNGDYDFFSDCNGAFLFDLQKEWNLKEANFTIDGNDYMVLPEDCQNTLCPQLSLTFQDSTYAFNYMIPFINSDNNLDTLVKNESGTYTINFCYTSTSNPDIADNWNGIIHFKGFGIDPIKYSSSFNKTINQALILSDVEYENRTIDFSLTD